jgi:hypothetical protein
MARPRSDSASSISSALSASSSSSSAGVVFFGRSLVASPEKRIIAQLQRNGELGTDGDDSVVHLGTSALQSETDESGVFVLSFLTEQTILDNSTARLAIFMPLVDEWATHPPLPRSPERRDDPPDAFDAVEGDFVSPSTYFQTHLTSRYRHRKSTSKRQQCPSLIPRSDSFFSHRK